MPRSLTEDEIDDLIYAARADDLDSLKTSVEALSKELEQTEAEVLLVAVDPYSKSTPLHMACANGNLDIVEYILSHFPTSSTDTTTPVTLKNDSGNTPLHWACLNGHQAIVEKLCDAGADPFVKNLAGQDALFQAENNEKLEVVDYILTRFQDVLEAEEEEKDRQAELAEKEAGGSGDAETEEISAEVEKLEIQESTD
ncbi:putative cytoplasmic ankyrin-repeat protein [Myxozyma melibiosi]|uniref:Cytoplasmic ankyrin-repeat protein n=1 Tax=Myxozyma melibiosi TaxID=54550 RepID=A0ABR1F905_9ASCO